MAKVADENKNNFEGNLKFLGLDLEKIPKALLDFKPLEFTPSSAFNDNDHQVFKFVPINQIYILITPKNRLDDIKDKYGEAKPISAYLNPKNIEEYSTFLRLLSQMSIPEVENIENRQKMFNENIPFGIQYDKDYSWQIYYSEASGKYFMLVTTEDYDYSHFFYLLKQQLEYHKSRTKKEKQIFVPINHISYSGKYLKKAEIADIENYLWLFTKDWPNVYEVYDKKEKMNIEIIGNTNVYKTVKGGYKISLKSEKDAIDFYKYIKALFILQTELPFHYNFTTKIEEDCSIALYYNEDKITNDNLTEFITKEFIKAKKQLEEEKQNVGDLEKRLTELKEESALKDLEYIKKQKEIAMYLEYKKTFVGKIRLFLKYKKKPKNNEETIEKNDENDIVEEKTENLGAFENKKEHYTIEDLVTIYAKLDKETGHVKDLKADIKALELKIKNLKIKIDNASKYIDEIDSHKKSIFDFWKFVNKDELVAIEGADEKEQSENLNNIRKVFDYKSDLLDLGVQMDKLQRNIIEKDAQDSIFLADDSEILKFFNIMKQIEYVDENDLRDYMKELKKIADDRKKIYKIEDFDIFGSISDSTRKIKTLANQKHRENEKDIIKILNISKNMDLIEFRTRLEKALEFIKDSMGKVKCPYDLPAYIAMPKNKDIDKVGYCIYDIVPEDAIACIKDSKEKEFNLYKINLKENMPLIFYTNIMYYDNFNQTLPLGMNVKPRVLIDADEFEFIPNNMTTFNISDDLIERELLKQPEVKKIMLCEYEVKMKNSKEDEKENSAESEEKKGKNKDNEDIKSEKENNEEDNKEDLEDNNVENVKTKSKSNKKTKTKKKIDNKVKKEKKDKKKGKKDEEDNDK